MSETTNPNRSQVLMRLRAEATYCYIYGPGLLYEIAETPTYHYNLHGSTIALTHGSGKRGSQSPCNGCLIGGNTDAAQLLIVKTCSKDSCHSLGASGGWRIYYAANKAMQKVFLLFIHHKKDYELPKLGFLLQKLERALPGSC